MTHKTHYDAIIIGGGAAGLMAAVSAGKKGKSVLLIEHSNKIGEKIRISGGGRCNFTNLNATSQNYICQNPHFVKSALASFTQQDFIHLVESYKIQYHEKTLGQLFCDGSSQQIITMMLDLCRQHHVEILLNCNVQNVTKNDTFEIMTTMAKFTCTSLIIATGGLSIPKIGATDFGYRLAQQFGLRIIPTRPALVPLILAEPQKQRLQHLSGISQCALVRYNKTTFRENILLTHKGVSGPAILQISSYLDGFDHIEINLDLLPDLDLHTQFERDKNHKQTPANYLKPYLANRLIDHLSDVNPHYHTSITSLKKKDLFTIADDLHNFKIHVNGSEGYLKAEVTAGGVDTNELSSKTMESKKVPHLFFIGEVVDVTGWLGGYNFQWAWSSGFVAGNYC